MSENGQSPAVHSGTNGRSGSTNGDSRVRVDAINIRGARVHNLRNLDVEIPRDRLVVLTGVSGSGKSSLAFDTLYAEGKRQYIESLSIYARQFLDQVARPDVDVIDGLQPTLCIDQRPGSQNPRSTVATVTEIYDYLRLLMARLGEVSCYACGQPIRQQSIDQIVELLLEMPEGTKTMILAPIVRGRKGAQKEILAKIRRHGLVRVRVDGLVCELDDVPKLSERKKHNIDAVVDRVIIRPDIEQRLVDSVRTAVDFGEGLMSICYQLPDAETTAENSEANENDDAEDDPSPQPNGWQDEFVSTRYACPNCNISYEELEPRTFSFNSPYGACPVCEGLGLCEQFDPSLVVPSGERSWLEGAVEPWKGATSKIARANQSIVEDFLASRKLRMDKPTSEFSETDKNAFLVGDGKEFPGILVLLEKELATATSASRMKHLAQYRAKVVCTACDGSRLRPESNSVRLGGKTIAEITSQSVGEARQFFQKLAFRGEQRKISRPLLAAIDSRLEFLSKVGVDYLTLNRSADTLSGGEFQRVRLATSIGSGLVGVCYILDEPSIGLHPRDNQRLIDSLRDLQSLGNTVLVVEHDEAIMKIADHLIDMGPGAGSEGGQIVALGTPQEVMRSAESLTGQYLSGKHSIELPKKRRRIAKSRSLVIQDVTTHNLRGVDVRVPLAALVCVTGVSGSGKSSLINETLAPALLRRLGRVAPKPGPFHGLRGVNQIDKVVQIDQSPIGRSSRSNPATYTGVFDEIRKVFAGTREAKQRGFTASRFSFNNKEGRCEACQGHGEQKIEMSFMPDLYVTCDACDGARFNRQTLQAFYRGKTIADVLAMSVASAAEFFQNFVNIARVFEGLKRVGLGYLRLGQPSTTLSGGEAQRIKLANELSRQDSGKTLYLLDEPTTGLHFDDIRRLLDVLGELVDRGNTVLIIEHNLEVIKCADWIIDLGPEGGDKGGLVVAEGTPEQVALIGDSYTGQFLKRRLNG